MSQKHHHALLCINLFTTVQWYQTRPVMLTPLHLLTNDTSRSKHMLYVLQMQHFQLGKHQQTSGLMAKVKPKASLKAKAKAKTIVSRPRPSHNALAIKKWTNEICFFKLLKASYLKSKRVSHDTRPTTVKTYIKYTYLHNRCCPRCGWVQVSSSPNWTSHICTFYRPA